MAAALLDGFFQTCLSGWHLRIGTFFDLRVSAQWGFGERRNPDWHVIYTVDGRGTYHLDGQAVPLEPGRLILISPGYPHAARPDPRNLPHIIPLRFHLARDQSLSAAAPPRVEKAALHTVLTPEVGSQVLCSLRRCRDLMAPDHLQDAATLLRQQAEIVSVLATLRDCLTTTTHVRRDPFTRLIAEMRTNPHQRRPLAELARQAGLSEKHFIRAFRARTGETPHAFLIRLRCERAAFLLTESDDPMSVIADELGYADPPTFARQFRSFWKKTPSDFRQQHRP